jgi:predicted phosphodiesterase
MNVAVFSDVHGNLIALRRFIQATESVVDAYLCLGDVVNYGPWNDECLETVWQLPGITLLEGNHERLFLGKEDIHHELPLVQAFYGHSIRRFTRADLIMDLPCYTHLGIFDCRHTIDGRSVYSDTTITIERNYMIGHSHHQFKINRSGFMIVNPGSVGQNRQWIDMIDYLILDTMSGEMDMYSVSYDFNLFLSELHLRHYPDDCIQYYANKPRKHNNKSI